MTLTDQPATVDLIRKEWYAAVTDCFFYGSMHEMEGHAEESETARDGLFILIQFGVRSKLIAPDEGNDWLAALSGREPWGLVMERWNGEATGQGEPAGE